MWAVSDWHVRTQGPQHLARGLMEAGHRVFYLSTNLVDDSQPGFNLEQLDDGGRLFQVSLNAAGAPEIYYGMPTAATFPQLRPTSALPMPWAATAGGLPICQPPLWTGVQYPVPG